jgi:hypothetical protein
MFSCVLRRASERHHRWRASAPSYRSSGLHTLIRTEIILEVAVLLHCDLTVTLPSASHLEELHVSQLSALEVLRESHVYGERAFVMQVVLSESG